MSDSIYIARWAGFLGALTEGDIDAECTWTQAQVEAALGDAGFDADICCCFGPLLMDPKCTVTGDDFSDARQCGATVEEMQRLMEFLGAPEWQMKYVLELARGDLRMTMKMDRERVIAGWTRTVRGGLEGVPLEEREHAIAEIVSQIDAEVADAKVSRSDLLSVCWLAGLAPKRYGARLATIMTRGLESVLLYEGDDIHADYVIETMNECIVAVGRHTRVDVDTALATFSKSATIWSLDQCGQAALLDLGWTPQEAYRVDDMILDLWEHIKDTPWHELGDNFYFIDALKDFVYGYCEDFAARYLGNRYDPRAEEAQVHWGERIESDFRRHWYSIDFRLYLPFLRAA